MGIIKWNYETCYNEAKKYETKSDFEKGSRGAYKSALKNKWLDNYTWFIDGNKRALLKRTLWNKETCYKEAQKYKTKSEFKYGSNGAYNVARKNKWLDDYTWFENGRKLFAEKITKWTYGKCLEESKKYSSRKEFCDGSVGAYTRALNNNWLDDFTWLKNENMWSDQVDSVYGYFFEDNSVYIGRTLMRCQRKRDLQHIFEPTDAVHIYAKEHNFSVPQMTILEDNLTIEEGCKKEGYWVEYYKEHNYNVINRCKTGGIGSLGRGIWNKERCYEEAKKYKSSTEFSRGSGGAYNAACRNKWLDDYDWLKHSKAKYRH